MLHIFGLIPFKPNTRATRISCLAALALACLASAAHAQSTIRVRLINGKNGKPLTPTSIRVQPDSTEVPTYLVPAADPASVLVTLRFATKVSVSNQFVSCVAAAPDAPPAQYSVKDILDHGVVSTNTCNSSQPAAAPKPGELTLYVRHATLCEESRNHIHGINFCGS